MSFKIHSADGGRIPAFEYLPCSAIAPKIGMVLTFGEDGMLAAASGTAMPTYISMCDRETPAAQGDIIPVIRVSDDIILETTVSGDASGVKLGTKLTVAVGGMQVTATEGGAAEVVYLDGTVDGSAVRVRFN